MLEFRLHRSTKPKKTKARFDFKQTTKNVENSDSAPAEQARYEALSPDGKYNKEDELISGRLKDSCQDQETWMRQVRRSAIREFDQEDEGKQSLADQLKHASETSDNSLSQSAEHGCNSGLLTRPLSPEEKRDLLMKSQLLSNGGELGLAEALVRVVLGSNSKDTDAQIELIKIFRMQERWQEARLIGVQLCSEDQSEDALFELATTLYMMKEDQEALEVYLRCLLFIQKEGERLFEIYKNIGNIYCRSQDLEAAEEYYNKAYTLDPDSDVLLVNYGTMEIQRDCIDTALDRFRTAARVNPHNDRAWTGLAMIHNQLGDFEIAWANLENALDQNPGNRTALHMGTIWALRDQRFTFMEEALGRSLDHEEGNRQVATFLIQLLLAQGKKSVAEIEIERQLLWDPSDEELLVLRERVKSLEV